MRINRLFLFLLLVPLLLCALSGCNTCPVSSSDPLRVEKNRLKLTKGTHYEAFASEYFSFKQIDEYNHIVQGGYFNGKELYVAMIHGDAPSDTVKIAVFDTNGKLLRGSGALDLDHANNLAYDTARRAFLVTHCQQREVERWSGYSLVDPDTLSVIETGDLEKPFFALGCAQDMDYCASGEWGGETIDIWDKDLRWLKSFQVERPNSLSQGAWCDSTGIWFVRSSQNDSGSEIRVYDWTNGDLLYQIPIKGMSNVEPESLTILGEKLYIVCNNAAFNGGIVYTVTLRPVK